MYVWWWWPGIKDGKWPEVLCQPSQYECMHRLYHIMHSDLLETATVRHISYVWLAIGPKYCNWLKYFNPSVRVFARITSSSWSVSCWLVILPKNNTIHFGAIESLCSDNLIFLNDFESLLRWWEESLKHLLANIVTNWANQTRKYLIASLWVC